MTRRQWITLVVGVIALAFVSGWAAYEYYSLRDSSTQDGPAYNEHLVTYTVGAGGDATADITMSYGEQRWQTTIPAGENTWAETITVSTGTWVKVTVYSDSVIQPRCWISDAGDHRVFDQDQAPDVARCQVLAHSGL